MLENKTITEQRKVHGYAIITRSDQVEHCIYVAAETTLQIKPPRIGPKHIAVSSSRGLMLSASRREPA